MLRTQFEEDLLNLHNQFYEMGMLVSKAIHNSVQAYVKHDRRLAEEVIAQDEMINQLEVRLEKKSFEMIALQQPVTTDLRRIITVMKASSDLERMGDHAVVRAQEVAQVDMPALRLHPAAQPADCMVDAIERRKDLGQQCLVMRAVAVVGADGVAQRLLVVADEALRRARGGLAFGQPQWPQAQFGGFREANARAQGPFGLRMW